ncbi:hypothetical protein EDC04DRAFT_2613125 [Pisolithus marmoratus]|nr:hypothetical protein EDC04DRAFT_2613125 [Pisolithus marmoratus]
MSNNIKMPPNEAAGPLSHSTETVETESITEETMMMTMTSSGMEMVNITTPKLHTCTTKTMETTSQHPMLLLFTPTCFQLFPGTIPIRSLQLTSRKSQIPTSQNIPQTASSVATPSQFPPTPKYPLAAQPIHPDSIKPPTTPINEFYVVIVGQEPGIFYSWNDAAARVLGVSKNATSSVPHSRKHYNITGMHTIAMSRSNEKLQQCFKVSVSYQ